MKRNKWTPEQWLSFCESSPIMKYHGQRVLQLLMYLLSLKGVEVLLDVGCGYGRFSVPLSSIAKEAYLLDISNNMIKYITDKKFPNVIALVGDAHRLPFKNNSFDVSLSTGVLDHTLNPNKCIQEMVRVTKSDGKILINAGNRFHWFHILLPLLRKILRKELGDIERTFSLRFMEVTLKKLKIQILESHGTTLGLYNTRFELFGKYLHFIPTICEKLLTRVLALIDKTFVHFLKKFSTDFIIVGKKE